MKLQLLEDIEKILGWRPTPADEGAVKHLNEFPSALLEAAKSLPPLLRHQFVRHYVGGSDSYFIALFIEDVVQNGEEVRFWRRGRFIVPDFSARNLIQMTVREIVSPLGASELDAWCCIPPRRAYWESGERLCGAPGLLRPSLDYRYVPPVNVIDILLVGELPRRVANVSVAVRRWVAANLASVAAKHGIPCSGTPQGLLNACFPDVMSISADAVAAARGLITESALPEDDDQVPGFRGLDAWYAEAKD
jgi:hypothetical protein